MTNLAAETVAIRNDAARIESIRLEEVDEVMCDCGRELLGECQRCRTNDELEALGEEDGERADDMARFGC